MTYNPDPLTITIIGAAGLIGVRHVEHVVAEDLTSFHSVVDPTAKGEELAKRHGVPYYRNLEELLTSTQRAPEAAIIATPSSLHIAQAVTLLRAGVHVLVEKPLCSDAEEAQPLLEASRETKASVLVGFHRRFNPYILRLKTILSGSSSLGVDPLGQIVAVSGLWCTRKPLEYFTDVPWRMSTSAGGGVILTNLSHELDLACFLFGDIKRVYAEPGAKTRGFDAEETVTIVLSFTSGCVGTFVLSE
jgi:predicted dehydrogenase